MDPNLRDTQIQYLETVTATPPLRKVTPCPLHQRAIPTPLHPPLTPTPVLKQVTPNPTVTLPLKQVTHSLHLRVVTVTLLNSLVTHGQPIHTHQVTRLKPLAIQISLRENGKLKANSSVTSCSSSRIFLIQRFS